MDSWGWEKLFIIINIRGQTENRPLENSWCAGRKWLPAGCKFIYGPVADWFLDIIIRWIWTNQATLLTRKNHLRIVRFEVNE